MHHILHIWRFICTIFLIFQNVWQGITTHMEIYVHHILNVPECMAGYYYTYGGLCAPCS